MLLTRYTSPYRNYAHLLFVTPSKHLMVLKDGRLKDQAKAVDVHLEKIASATREHLVHYIVADHTSSAFYAETRSGRSLQSAVEFLKRAWQKKEGFFFHGIPEVLSVPAAVAETFPDVLPWLASLGVRAFAPTSGFQAGVHQVRNWDNDLAAAASVHEYLNGVSVDLSALEQIISATLKRSNEALLSRSAQKMTRRELWESPRDAWPPIRSLEAASGRP